MSVVRIELDEATKAQAEAVVSAWGDTLPKVLQSWVEALASEREKIPNAETKAAIEALNRREGVRSYASFSELVRGLDEED